MVVASENSVHKLLELLPGKVLNGEKVDVRPATRQNLSQFEAQARKRECVRVPRGGTWRPSVWRGGILWVCFLCCRLGLHCGGVWGRVVVIMGGSMALGELKMRLMCQESGSSGYTFLLLTHVAFGKSLYCLRPTSPFELDTVYKVPVTSELCVYYLKNQYIANGLTRKTCFSIKY